MWSSLQKTMKQTSPCLRNICIWEESDTGAVLRGFRNQDREEQDTEMQDTEMEDDASIADDQYNFMLQFSCYILADKLQALGFKRHTMDEIRRHGEFCDPVDLIMNDARYVYDNTVSQNDPLRRFCVVMKCKRVPIEQALEDSDFIALMEDAGSLVKDVMQMCRELTLKQKQRTVQFQDQAQKLEGMCQTERAYSKHCDQQISYSTEQKYMGGDMPWLLEI